MNKQPDPGKACVVIVEDHPMFRERLAHLIDREPDMRVCAEADNIHDGFEAIKNAGAQIAIVDLTLKGSSGLELIKNLKAHGIDVPILVLSMHDESLYAERVLRAGGSGYIAKHEASAKVMTAIRQVLQGEIYFSKTVVAKILKNAVAAGPHRAVGFERLTDREIEVFELIGHGRTTREISARLHLGATTVDTYRARIKEKLDLQNAAQLQSEASRWVREREFAAPAV